MTGNDVFYAMLFGGDWSGNDFRNAKINYMVLETGYSREDVVSYIEALEEFEMMEIDNIYSYVSSDSYEESINSNEYISNKTGLPMLKVILLNSSETEFHKLIEDSFERITVLLTA